MQRGAWQVPNLEGEIRTWRRSFLRRRYDHTLRPRILRQDLRDEIQSELCAEPKTKAQEAQIRFAKNQGEGQDGEPGGFRPMYYTHSYKSDPEKIEMSFDCTNYQHQFRIDHDANEAPIPYEQHIFQSYFLRQDAAASVDHRPDRREQGY
jgi:hypothetical protein